jgi:hypothetical protein
MVREVTLTVREVKGYLEKYPPSVKLVHLQHLFFFLYCC